MKQIKLITLLLILCIFILIPTTFAADNETIVMGDAIHNDSSTEDLLMVSDSDSYYYDAISGSDSGDGSKTNPFKSLTSERISAKTNHYLANGEYVLNYYAYIINANIIGTNPSKTIISYNGNGFQVSNSLTLSDLTLNNLRITNNGKLTATNVIFTGFKSSTIDGGGIYSNNKNSFIDLNNCTFRGNSARFGGAIYFTGDTLNINNCLFVNNSASSFGGAISNAYNQENINKINIYNTKFINDQSTNNAGGALFIKECNFTANNIEIINCTSSFGGALVSLNSYVYINNLKARNNKAKYDGGAIYAMYRDVTIEKSIFENNLANNGGAIFATNIPSLYVKSNIFVNNDAYMGEAVYSIANDVYYDSILDKHLNNTFLNNNVYENDLPNLFIGNNNYSLMKVNYTDIEFIPSRYDLRELGLVTPVKNQMSGGNCWTFSSLGALESSILKATGVEYILSENNMKNLMGKYSVYGWNLETNAGGYDDMGLAYLVNWLGPVYDNDDTYYQLSLLSPVLDSIIHIQDYLVLERKNYTDNDAVKKAIMNYGAVDTSLYWSSSYLKNSKYYYSGTSLPNHAVVLVGWDDDMEIPGAPDKGAWIVQNSWGTSWGDKGYFYVSYYDTKFAEPNKENIFVFVLNDTIKFDKNYQYDIPGKTDYFLNSSSKVWYKNRYTSTDNEYLTAVSTYFYKNTNWELSVYVNNKLKLTQSGFATSSYKTINLNQLIPLNKGDVFEIVFYTTVDSGDSYVPISEEISLNTEFYSENYSFISYDGKNWKDLYNLSGKYSTHTYYSQVACIKAFTILNPLVSSIELDVISNYSPCEFKAVVKDQYGNLVKSGTVTFTVDGKNINVNVLDGIAKLVYSYDSYGNKVVTASFSATGYESSKITVPFVYRYSTRIIASDVVTFYGQESELVVTMVNAVGKGISGANVVVDIDGVKYSLKTNSKGQIQVSTSDLPSGTYTAKITYKGSSKYDPANETVKIIVNKIDTRISLYYDPSTKELVAYLVNIETGAGINNANVVFNINGVKTSVKTKQGHARFSIGNTDPNNFNAGVSYGGNSKYFKSTSSIKIIEGKIPTVISNVYNKQKGEVVATLINNETGKPISGGTIVFNLNGVKTPMKSNKQGQAIFSVIDLDPDVYYMGSSYGGNSKYAGSTTAIYIVKY